MCLILDINILHKVYPNANEDHAPISRALKDKKATMVYGGKLRREYLKANWFRKFLRRLDQSGAAKIVPDQEVDLRTQAIASAGGYISNDPHILALAIVANVRLVCTDDDD